MRGGGFTGFNRLLSPFRPEEKLRGIWQSFYWVDVLYWVNVLSAIADYNLKPGPIGTNYAVIPFIT